MSIFFADIWVAPIQLIWAMMLMAGGLTVAWFAGAFEPRKVVGPLRIEPRDPLMPLWMLVMLGLAVWLLVPAIFEHRQQRHRRPRPARRRPSQCLPLIRSIFPRASRYF
jgi:hypothetical protein